jgi:hypothetical protein
MLQRTTVGSFVDELTQLATVPSTAAGGSCKLPVVAGSLAHSANSLA